MVLLEDAPPLKGALVREKLARLIKNRMDPNRYGWAGHFRWPLLSIAVGMVSGLGAILFEELLRQALYHFLHLSTGFLEPMRRSEAAAVAALADIRSPLFLIIPALGGLVSGILVFLIAPEAEGKGPMPGSTPFTTGADIFASGSSL